MPVYIAKTLLYDPRLTRTDPETGELVEQGYIQPGEPIELEETRAEILLGLGHIEAPPDPKPTRKRAGHDEAPGAETA